jgi:hypothetical protein
MRKYYTYTSYTELYTFNFNLSEGSKYAIDVCSWSQYTLIHSNMTGLQTTAGKKIFAYTAVFQPKIKRYQYMRIISQYHKMKDIEHTPLVKFYSRHEVHRKGNSCYLNRGTVKKLLHRSSIVLKQDEPLTMIIWGPSFGVSGWEKPAKGEGKMADR